MILIVDDEKEAVQILSDILKEKGYESSGCYDGDSTLKKAKELKPKVVLLDYNLPDMNGILVTRELLDMMPRIRVIMTTGSSDTDLEKAANKAGVFSFLTKPVDLGILLELIKKAMR